MSDLLRAAKPELGLLTVLPCVHAPVVAQERCIGQRRLRSQAASDGSQRHVSGTLHHPFIVLLQERGADPAVATHQFMMQRLTPAATAGTDGGSIP